MKADEFLEKGDIAMAAGVSDTLHDMEWIVGLIDARAPKPGPRVPYKRRARYILSCNAILFAK